MWRTRRGRRRRGRQLNNAYRSVLRLSLYPFNLPTVSVMRSGLHDTTLRPVPLLVRGAASSGARNLSDDPPTKASLISSIIQFD